jgi:hypothetical protein
MINRLQVARNLAYLDRVKARQARAAKIAAAKQLLLIAAIITAFSLFALYTGAIY